MRYVVQEILEFAARLMGVFVFYIMKFHNLNFTS